MRSLENVSACCSILAYITEVATLRYSKVRGHSYAAFDLFN